MSTKQNDTIYDEIEPYLGELKWSDDRDCYYAIIQDEDHPPYRKYFPSEWNEMIEELH